MNDVTATNGDTEQFTSEYKAVIEKFQEEVPDAHIFVNFNLPGADSSVVRGSRRLPPYRSIMKRCSTLCAKA